MPQADRFSKIGISRFLKKKGLCALCASVVKKSFIKLTCYNVSYFEIQSFEFESRQNWKDLKALFMGCFPQILIQTDQPEAQGHLFPPDQSRCEL